MKVLRNILFIGLAFGVWSCAQILAPTGGPRDTEPPKLLRTSPEQRSTHVTQNEFKLSFDEFFSLQNPNNNVLISPPLSHSPEFKTKGKVLIVNIKDTLKSNTTYSINFANCIRDITENNTIKTLTYIFSTGSFIDSNSIKGKVVNAQTLLPEKEVSVVLYKSDIDSLPITEKPYYLTKTNETGEFAFSFLAEGRYAIYALLDKNNNMISDLASEAFAFHNEMIESKPLADISESDFIDLYLFTHADTIQRINRSFSTAKGLQTLAFKNPYQEIEFSVLNESIKNERFYFEFNTTKDSVQIYDLEMSVDTILLKVSDLNFADTLKFTTQQEPPRRGVKRGVEASNHLFGSLIDGEHAFLPTYIEFSFPIKEILNEDFTMIKDEVDTLSGKMFINESLPKRVMLSFEKLAKSKYAISIPDSIIIGYNGLTNDSINQLINVRDEADYGHFTAKIKYNQTVPVLVQLVDEQGKILEETTIFNSEDLHYRNKLPKTYRMAFVFDINNNGRWDTGNYFTKMQPEPKHFLEKPFAVKANWEIEESIDLDEIFLKLKID
ncbi:MAG: Ig-like domain-containing protein [Bacteroidales bacterium]|nr:Ig-like domain-containing protein [Bacteroidales bacterium]MDY0215571.1 Ig-like domain-containing protein [Bacteroidales bacterium]